MLETFTTVSEAQCTKLAQSNSIRSSQSPFKDGVTFKLVRFAYQRLTINGKVDENSRAYPGFETSIGFCFLSMCVKEKMDANGKVLKADGTFNDIVREAIANPKNKADADIFAEILKAVKGKEIKVSRVPYAVRGHATSVAYLVVLDVVEPAAE